ncbi:MAG: NADH-quinone oxidoreductase subunit J [Candidatus Baltobacteraceae bacterium]
MIAFWLLAIALIVSAVFTITQKKPVYSVVGLLANFAVLAMLYLALSAEFLAVIQIVVYSGAILILFLFVIALLSSGVAPFNVGPDRLSRVAGPAIVLCALALVLLLVGVEREPLGIVPSSRLPTSIAGPVGAANVFGSVGDFGAALFTTYLLPFEITAFILMVAVIGVVVLAGDAAPQATRAKPRRRGQRVRESIVKESPPREKGVVR